MLWLNIFIVIFSEVYTGNEGIVDKEKIVENPLAEQNINENNTPMQQAETNPDNLALNMQEKQNRRRKSDPKLWKASQRKEKRNKGVEYVGTTGKIRLPKFPKNIGQSCDCINDDMKSAIFRAFWDLGSIERQRGFLIKHVQRSAVTRTRTENSRRGFSQKYILGLNNQNFTVCKTFFFKTKW